MTQKFIVDSNRNCDADKCSCKYVAWIVEAEIDASRKRNDTEAKPLQAAPSRNEPKASRHHEKDRGVVARKTTPVLEIAIEMKKRRLIPDIGPKHWPLTKRQQISTDATDEEGNNNSDKQENEGLALMDLILGTLEP